MPRPKRKTEPTPLARWLMQLLEENHLLLKDAAKIAGSPVSTVAGWKDGASPAESIPAIKTLANHFGVSLSYALTGEPDAGLASAADQRDEESELFSGDLRVTLHRLKKSSDTNTKS